MADKKYTSFEQAQAQEKARVDALIIRDREYQAREDDRRRAEIEVSGGTFVNLSDTVVEPTPEWLEKGNVSTFRPKQPDGTVRVIKTVRRKAGMVLFDMHMEGRINDDHFTACMWYRSIYEQAGVDGRFKTSSISMTGNTGGGSGAAQHPMARHEREAYCRELYRLVKLELNPRFLEVFELVVVDGLSLRAASRKARRDNSRLLANFILSANRVLDFCHRHNIDFAAKSNSES